MTTFALPYDPDAAPVMWIVGHGFTPAWQPADYIGPRMDCPMWLPAPDADVAYHGKLDPWDHMPASGYAWGTVLPPVPAPQITAASLAGPVVPFTAGPLIPGPWWPPVDYPCQCITTPPDVPPVAPVPIPASAGLLIAAAAVLMLWRRK